jgi:hypothetical protein
MWKLGPSSVRAQLVVPEASFLPSISTSFKPSPRPKFVNVDPSVLAMHPCCAVLSVRHYSIQHVLHGSLVDMGPPCLFIYPSCAARFQALKPRGCLVNMGPGFPFLSHMCCTVSADWPFAILYLPHGVSRLVNMGPDRCRIVCPTYGGGIFSANHRRSPAYWLRDLGPHPCGWRPNATPYRLKNRHRLRILAAGLRWTSGLLIKRICNASAVCTC